MRNQVYTVDFYETSQEGVRRSARQIVPLILELIQPKRVIDVGCGLGTWLSIFREYGVDQILGVDGDWVDRRMLEIPEEHFLSFDLRKPLRMDGRFDLVMSLEVAEHLPCECAETFVDSLIGLGPVILFSAAIPLQGGTRHENEQWPEYWVKRFQDKGYLVIDYIRRKVWDNDAVQWWYAQNVLMFVREDYLESCPLLKTEFENSEPLPLAIVHTKNYLRLSERCLALSISSDPRNMPLSKVLSALPALMKSALKRRARRLLGSFKFGQP